MKTLSLQKIHGRRLIILAQQVVFLGVLGYFIYYLNHLYQSLYFQQSSSMTGRVPRSNLNAYKQAVDRYKSYESYRVSEGAIPTPFKVPPKPSQDSLDF
jgi:hypothetical protein